MMKTLVVVLAVAGQWQYSAASRAPTRAPARVVAPAPHPPTIEVKFNEDAATKDDVKALADAIAALRKEVAALKAAPKPPASIAAKAAAPPPARRRWELTDDRGKRWWSYDPDALCAHVARENAAILRGTSPASFDSPFLGTPMSFGGFSGSCAGGSCR